MRRLSAIAVVAALAVLTSGCMFALVDWSDPFGKRSRQQPPKKFDTTTLSGVVTDRGTGEPIASATVFAYSRDYSDKVGTEPSGQFTVRVVKNTVTAVVIYGSRGGYEDSSDQITVADEPIRKTYTLARKRSSEKH